MGRKLRDEDGGGIDPRAGSDDLSGLPAGEGANDAADLLALAEYIYRCRRIRDEMLGADYFGEPAWDLLLGLYIGETRGRAPLGNLSTNTALRWQSVLETEGLVTRRTDGDAAGSNACLTAKGHALMRDYLRKAGSPAP